jgi:DNA-binding beta-propeller fold protein YncE
VNVKILRRAGAFAAVALPVGLIALLAWQSAVAPAMRRSATAGAMAVSAHATSPASIWVKGSEGSGPGQFQGPSGIDVLGDRIYIADKGNYRVQVWDLNGNYVESIGQPGDQDGEFLSLNRVSAGSNGTIYVSEDNGRIQKIPDFGRVYRWGGAGTGNGQFKNASGIVVDIASGYVYVVDSGNSRVQKFSQFGDFVGTWGTPGNGKVQFKSPTGIARKENRTFCVADTGNDRIQEVDEDGDWLQTIGSPGGQLGELSAPMGVAVDTAGNVYVADTGNDRVAVFDRSGTPITQWSVTGGDSGKPSAVADIAVDADGYVYVIDASQNNVQKFAPISTSVDRDAPDTTVRNADDKWHNHPVVLTFTADDHGGSGVDYTEYRIAGGGWARGASATVPAPADHSGDGSQQVTYRSWDVAGNREPNQSVTIRIDTRAPVVAVRPVHAVKGRLAIVSFGVGEALSSKIRVVASVETSDGRVLHQAKSGWLAKKGANGWSFKVSFPTGHYRVKIVAYDLAGNKSAPGSALFVVN